MLICNIRRNVITLLFFHDVEIGSSHHLDKRQTGIKVQKMPIVGEIGCEEHKTKKQKKKKIAA